MVVERVNAMYRCCRQHMALAVKRFSYIPGGTTQLPFFAFFALRKSIFQTV
jgi:hypothetical protein